MQIQIGILFQLISYIKQLILKCWEHVNDVSEWKLLSHWSKILRNYNLKTSVYYWVNLVKNACPTWYWTISVSLMLFLDKIIFHLIISLIIVRPKDNIPAFPAKAEEKAMVFQLFQPISCDIISNSCEAIVYYRND